jgi:protease-4
MTLETDLILDRRRLKRRLVFWRVFTVIAVFVAVVAIVGVRGALPRDHIARLQVAGIITQDPRLVRTIERIADDPHVPALIVSIDSPGGSVAGGESLHDAIALVAAHKPVVAVMGGTAASAGYMIAMPAARVFAHASTLTGSIGVILETGEASGLLSKIGLTADAITSGPLKDQPSFTRPLTQEGRAYLHGLVMDLFDQFVGMVAQGRHMDAAKVRELADGRAYTGRQALALGLVDEIGGEQAARDWLAKEKGVSSALPVRNLRVGSFAERTFGAMFGAPITSYLKMMFSQWLTLDGAWALWQPSRPLGE